MPKPQRHSATPRRSVAAAIRLTPAEADALDQLAASQSSSRSAVMRQLLQLGMDAADEDARALARARALTPTEPRA